MSTTSRKWHNKIVFWIIILIAVGIISLTIITDICLIKKNCYSESIERMTGTVVDKIPNVDYQISATDSLAIKSGNETIPQSNNLDSLNPNTNYQTTIKDGLTKEKNNAPIPRSYNLDSIVYYLTLAVDTVNNVLSGGAIALGILTLFLGLVGLFGYNTLKEDINDKTNRFEKTLNNQSEVIELFKTEAEQKIESIEKNFEDFKTQYESLVQSLNTQERFTNKAIEYLFAAIYGFINDPGPNDSSGGSTTSTSNGTIDENSSPREDSNDLLNNLFHNLQVLKLYRCSLDKDEAKKIRHGKKTALEFLAENGNKNDLPSLNEVAENEQDESIKNRIYEVIGIIKSKSSKNL